VHDGETRVEAGDPAVRGEEGVVGDHVGGQAEADVVDEDGLRAVEAAALTPIQLSRCLPVL